MGLNQLQKWWIQLQKPVNKCLHINSGMLYVPLNHIVIDLSKTKTDKFHVLVYVHFVSAFKVIVQTVKELCNWFGDYKYNHSLILSSIVGLPVSIYNSIQ